MKDLISFASQYNYNLNENRGPYRIINNFISQPKRAFEVFVEETPVYFSTYNSSKTQISHMIKIAEYFDSKIILYSNDLSIL